MDLSPLSISGFTGAAARIGATAAQILQDRLELLALELREAKIRVVQALLLACMGMVFSLLGFLLMVLAGVHALPPQWRLFGLAAAAVGSILAGAAAFAALSRRLDREPPALAQSLAELKKDMACFSTRT